jgi:mRNA-degrading endonuclease RelE of RelBE toxin-antitoxin system
VIWRIVWSPHAVRDFAKLTPALKERIAEVLRRYAETGQGDILRLHGVAPPEWRLRAGDHRIRLRLDSATQTLEVQRVQPRDKAYR